jgi:hypothetical protein
MVSGASLRSKIDQLSRIQIQDPGQEKSYPGSRWQKALDPGSAILVKNLQICQKIISGCYIITELYT